MKKIYLLFIPLFLSVAAFSQSQGPYSPASALSVPSPSGATWSTPGNVFVSDGNTAGAFLAPFPTCTGTNCFYTVGLTSGTYNFSIPLAATIDGIVAEVQRRTINLPVTIMDSSVKLLKAGIPVGSNYAGSVAWTVSLTYITYGSATDLWGTTWTPADINNTNFGLYFTVRNTTPNPNGAPQVDHMHITVYYTLPTGTYSQTITVGDLFSIAPSDELLEISCSETGTLNVLNVLGQSVFSREVKAGEELQIPASGLAKGVYFVKFANDESAQTKKIFIR